MINSPKRLLIVEDDQITRTLLQDVLEKKGYLVNTASDGPDALRVIQRYGLPHLVLLDLGLPHMHGFEVAARIKALGDVPIIVLTGDHSKQVAVHAIRQYAEDFVTKPFAVDEIVARIERVLRRFADLGPVNTPQLAIDDHLVIDFPHHCINMDSERIDLTPIEANLLHILVRSNGRVVSTELLLARVWPEGMAQPETLRVHMSRLRRKLRRKADSGQYIYTEREQGYVFRKPDG